MPSLTVNLASALAEESGVTVDHLVFFSNLLVAVTTVALSTVTWLSVRATQREANRHTEATVRTVADADTDKMQAALAAEHGRHEQAKRGQASETIGAATETTNEGATDHG